MIELRYREIVVTANEHYFRTDKVLQYRYTVHPDYAPDSYENGHAWSKWQDVPTVSAAADESDK